jgi:hypothetical protein
MVPDLLRLRATHLELPETSLPLWALTLPGKLAASLRTPVSLIQARSPATACGARSPPPRHKMDRHPARRSSAKPGSPSSSAAGCAAR